jgi:hypothetical protein
MGLAGECYRAISVMWKVPEPRDFLTVTLGLFVQTLNHSTGELFLGLAEESKVGSNCHFLHGL